LFTVYSDIEKVSIHNLGGEKYTLLCDTVKDYMEYGVGIYVSICLTVILFL